MATYILVFHFIVAVSLIVLILLQQGKGAEAGAVSYTHLTLPTNREV